MALRFLPGGTTGGVPVYYKSVPAILSMVNANVAYNFTGTGETHSYGDYSYTEDTDFTFHAVQFGFSVLL